MDGVSHKTIVAIYMFMCIISRENNVKDIINPITFVTICHVFT